MGISLTVGQHRRWQIYYSDLVSYEIYIAYNTIYFPGFWWSAMSTYSNCQLIMNTHLTNELPLFQGSSLIWQIIDNVNAIVSNILLESDRSLASNIFAPLKLIRTPIRYYSLQEYYCNSLPTNCLAELVTLMRELSVNLESILEENHMDAVFEWRLVKEILKKKVILSFWV